MGALIFELWQDARGGAKMENCGTAFRIAEQKTKDLHEESHASP